MKCPKCHYTSFDSNDSCPKCKRSLVQVREKLNLMAFDQTPSPVSTTASQASEDLDLLSRETDFGLEETVDLEFPEDSEDIQLDSGGEPEKEPTLDFSLDDEEDDLTLDAAMPEKPQPEKSEVTQDTLEMNLDFAFEDDSEELTLALNDVEGPESATISAANTGSQEDSVVERLESEQETLSSDMDFSFEEAGDELTLDLDEPTIGQPEAEARQEQQADTEDFDFDLNFETLEQNGQELSDTLTPTEDVTITAALQVEDLTEDDSETIGEEWMDEGKKQIITEELEESVSALLESIEVNEPSPKHDETKDQNNTEPEMLDLDLNLDLDK